MVLSTLRRTWKGTLPKVGLFLSHAATKGVTVDGINTADNPGGLSPPRPPSPRLGLPPFWPRHAWQQKPPGGGGGGRGVFAARHAQAEVGGWARGSGGREPPSFKALFKHLFEIPI